jgi:hypothetical protein
LTPECTPVIDWTSKPPPSWAMISDWSRVPGSSDSACAPTPGVVRKLARTAEPVEDVPARLAA